eukprot:7922-Heterococcus_DN1.PRE.5
MLYKAAKDSCTRQLVLMQLAVLYACVCRLLHERDTDTECALLVNQEPSQLQLSSECSRRPGVQPMDCVVTQLASSKCPPKLSLLCTHQAPLEVHCMSASCLAMISLSSSIALCKSARVTAAQSAAAPCSAAAAAFEWSTSMCAISLSSSPSGGLPRNRAVSSALTLLNGMLPVR